MGEHCWVRFNIGIQEDRGGGQRSEVVLGDREDREAACDPGPKRVKPSLGLITITITPASAVSPQGAVPQSRITESAGRLRDVKPGTALFTSVHVPDLGRVPVLHSAIIQLNSVILLYGTRPGPLW